MPDLSLRYIVRLEGNLNPEALKAQILAGIETKISDITQATRPQDVRIMPIEDKQYFIELKVNFSHDELSRLGPSIVLHMMLGNAFRSPQIHSLVLVDFYMDEPAGIFEGPRFGTRLLHEQLGTNSAALAFPLSSNLSLSVWKTMLSAALSAGITIFCDSPFAASTDQTVADRVAYLRTAREQTRFLYFFAGNGPLDRLLALLRLITPTDEDPFLGIRICPWSSGFEVAHLVRKSKVPLLLYSMLDLSMRSSGTSAISLPASLLIQRFVGGDIVAVGLTTAEAKADPNAEYAARCNERLTYRVGDTLPSSIPLFAGDLSPRRAFDLITAHGPLIAFQAKKPLLRDIPGASRRSKVAQTPAERLKFNATAFKEAIDFASAGLNVDRAFENNDGKIQTWIQFEKKD